MRSNTRPISGHPTLSCQQNRILSGNTTQTYMLYETGDREYLRWTACFPLPEIADRLQPKLARIDTVEVTGYFRAGDEIGVIAWVRNPPRWLREESEQDRTESSSALYRDGSMANKLCLLGSEIEPPIEEVHDDETPLSSRPRAAQAALRDRGAPDGSAQ